MELTDRQELILKAIITEFLKTAIPVGSLTLSDDYNLGVSPATLRAEMARLVDQGFLYKQHLSSGRVPTTMGIRYFINEMLEEEDIDTLQETKVKEHLFQNRYNRSKFMQEAVRALSDISGIAALSVVDDMVFSSGMGHLLSEPEFRDFELLQNAFDMIESVSMLSNIFDKYVKKEDLRIIVGDEIGIDSLSECSFVCAPFRFFRGTSGYLAAIGPRRMKYSQIIPAVRTVSQFIEEAIAGWE